MTYSYVLEAINASISVSCMFALGIFVHYIWANWHEGYIFLRPAIAMSFIWTGEIVLRTVIWMARHSFNHTHHMIGIAPEPIFMAVGYAILLAATLCCIRVFSPAKWGHKPWIIALVTSIAVAVWTTST